MPPEYAQQAVEIGRNADDVGDVVVTVVPASAVVEKPRWPGVVEI